MKTKQPDRMKGIGMHGSSYRLRIFSNGKASTILLDTADPPVVIV